MRLIPGMTVVMPSDGAETEKATRAAAAHDGPVYLCLAGGSHAASDESRPFRLGKALTLREGNDATVIATGPTVREALKAASILEGSGIAVRVIHLHTVKPIDTVALLAAASETPLVVTVEEHTTVGGLGGAVAEAVAEAGIGTPVKRLGLQDTFAWLVAGYDELKEHYGIAAAAIVRLVTEAGG
jgi:transketolase